jgi:hypothetical protein
MDWSCDALRGLSSLFKKILLGCVLGGWIFKNFLLEATNRLFPEINDEGFFRSQRGVLAGFGMRQAWSPRGGEVAVCTGRKSSAGGTAPPPRPTTPEGKQTNNHPPKQNFKQGCRVAGENEKVSGTTFGLQISIDPTYAFELPRITLMLLWRKKANHTHIYICVVLLAPFLCVTKKDDRIGDPLLFAACKIRWRGSKNLIEQLERTVHICNL